MTDQFVPAPDFMAPDPAQQSQDNCIPRFYSRPVEIPFKSAQAGHPIFEDQHFVEILIPGDRKTVIDRQVKREDKERWPRQWMAYQSAQEAPLEGTPLAEWPGIPRSLVEELGYSNVRTVEQLASLHDSALTAAVAMGGILLRDKAKRYLEHAQGLAPTETLAAEVERLAAKVTEQEAAITAQKAEIARLTEKTQATGGENAGT